MQNLKPFQITLNCYLSKQFNKNVIKGNIYATNESTKCIFSTITSVGHPVQLMVWTFFFFLP